MVFLPCMGHLGRFSGWLPFRAEDPTAALGSWQPRLKWVQAAQRMPIIKGPWKAVVAPYLPKSLVTGPCVVLSGNTYWFHATHNHVSVIGASWGQQGLATRSIPRSIELQELAAGVTEAL